MSSEEAASPRYFAIWSGRAGLKSTIACFALALPCALGILWLTERTTAVPTCRAYGETRGLVFTGVKHYSRDESTTVCIYTQASGETSEVSFKELAPFLTDLWVSFGVDLKFTIPAFAVLFALPRTMVFRRSGERPAAA